MGVLTGRGGISFNRTGIARQAIRPAGRATARAAASMARGQRGEGLTAPYSLGAYRRVSVVTARVVAS